MPTFKDAAPEWLFRGKFGSEYTELFVRKIFQRAGYPALLVVLIVAFYWKLSLTNQFDWMWGPDLAQQVLPWYEDEARQMRAGVFPLWDPHAWGGQPLLAQGQPGGAYPVNWLL